MKMKELTIISGKGGSGKTSITASFAALAEKCIIIDADVDAADLHLVMEPQIEQEAEFKGGSKAWIDLDLCMYCGECLYRCQFAAIKPNFVVDELACEGCGVCVHFCPANAIRFEQKVCGKWFVSNTPYGPLVHARLGIAEENSGMLVSLLRKETRSIAGKQGYDLIMTDGPPGIGCPVIASIGGASAILIVAEPTVSGLHDMERVAQLASHFKLPAMVCVNKFDLNPGQTEAIETIAKEKNMVVLGRIPFDPIFTKSMIQGKTIHEYKAESEIGKIVTDIWHHVMSIV